MRHLPDDELARINEPRLAALRRFVVLPQSTTQEHKPKKSGQADNNKGKPTLPDGQSAILQSIIEKPYLTTTQRAEWLGQSAYSFDAGKKALIFAGLVEDARINLGKETGGLCVFLELTADGYRALELKPPKQRPQNCSVEHWWYQRRIAEWYRAQGLNAEIECERNGKSADVGLQRDGKLIAIEIAITPANEVRNAQGDFDAGFDSVLIACKNTKVKKAVEDKLDFALDSDRRKRVSVTLLSEASFMKSVRGNVMKGSTQGV